MKHILDEPGYFSRILDSDSMWRGFWASVLDSFLLGVIQFHVIFSSFYFLQIFRFEMKPYLYHPSKNGGKIQRRKMESSRENSSDEVECFAWQLRMLTFLTSRFRREIFWSLVGYPNHTKGRLVDGQGRNMLPYKKVCRCWMLTLRSF